MDLELSVIIIILLIGLFSVYVFYLIGIYVKLENRRSLILTKFTEVNNQIENKLDLVKELNEILNNEDLTEKRLNLLNSISVNDKIKNIKILDSTIDELVDSDNKKIKKILDKLNKVNDKINYSKEFYNDSLYEYNIILSTKSGLILKKIFKYTEYNTF